MGKGLTAMARDIAHDQRQSPVTQREDVIEVASRRRPRGGTVGGRRADRADPRRQLRQQRRLQQPHILEQIARAGAPGAPPVGPTSRELTAKAAASVASAPIRIHRPSGITPMILVTVRTSSERLSAARRVGFAGSAGLLPGLLVEAGASVDDVVTAANVPSPAAVVLAPVPGGAFEPFRPRLPALDADRRFSDRPPAASFRCPVGAVPEMPRRALRWPGLATGAATRAWIPVSARESERGGLTSSRRRASSASLASAFLARFLVARLLPCALRVPCGAVRVRVPFRRSLRPCSLASPGRRLDFGARARPASSWRATSLGPSGESPR